MFKLISLFALVSAAFAASIGSTTEKREIIPLLSYERENNPDGSFSFSYEGGDQTFREETAHVVDAGTEDEALEVSGSYRYIDQDGNTVEVHYTAGKNGFVPFGTHILSEITAAAKAAADLAQNSEEESTRKGRSHVEEKAKAEKQNHAKPEDKSKKVEGQKKVAESKVEEPIGLKADQIPVTIVQEEEAKPRTKTL